MSLSFPTIAGFNANGTLFGGSLPNKLILWDDVETVDVGQSGILLRIEGIEGLVESFVTGDAAIDGTAFRSNKIHFRPPFTPKKAGPDQCVPVIARAAADGMPALGISDLDRKSVV